MRVWPGFATVETAKNDDRPEVARLARQIPLSCEQP